MCRWRHVRNLFTRCGHTESLVRSLTIHPRFRCKLRFRSHPLRSPVKASIVNSAPIIRGTALRLLAGTPAISTVSSLNNIISPLTAFARDAAAISLPQAVCFLDASHFRYILERNHNLLFFRYLFVVPPSFSAAMAPL